MSRPVIFTDLDGTLLDPDSYSFVAALPALRKAEQRGIPLVICSSKTRTEIDYWRRHLRNRHPFVTENGGGIVIPDGYFGSAALPPELEVVREGEGILIRLGAPYAALRSALRELRGEGFAVTGFGDMTVDDVVRITGLPSGQAAMAREREYDEPFLFAGDAAATELLVAAIRARGFTFTQGALCHIMGGSDKGRAVGILTSLYRAVYGEIVTVALGDSPNDLPMLAEADFPVVVQKRDGSYDPRLDLTGLIRAEGIGPVGWNGAVIDLLARLDRQELRVGRRGDCGKSQQEH